MIPYILLFQARPIILGRRKMQIRYPARQSTVHFFRVRGIFIISAQTCLHMSYRNLLIKSRQKRSRRIAVHQYQIRFFLLKNRPDQRENIRCDRMQRLRHFHDLQIIIHLNLKNIDHLLQHFPVLPCQADDALYLLIFPHFFDQRAHLDRLRPGAENAHNLYLLHFK